MGKVAFSGINIKNEGNCSVQIKWKKSQIPTSFEFESDDKMDYFHIHYVTFEIDFKGDVCFESKRGKELHVYLP